MDKFILIDGNSLINRAFYATPPMNASDGTPTNAVYAFMNMLIKIIVDVNPKYLLVAFDRKEPTFRHKMYAEYKGTRKPMPDDLALQIPVLKRVLDALKIARFERAGIEADDIIGTLAKRYDYETVIYTGDKDSFQLVDGSTSVYFTKRGISDIEEYNAYNFVDKVGIMPIQIIDLKALMGDSSDNIPGVKGIGEKTGLGLVQQFGSVENLYEHIDEVKGKTKEKLEVDRENCFMSKTLATINTHVDIDIDESQMTIQFPFGAEARAIFEELGFKNLLRKTELFDGVQNVVPERQTYVFPENNVLSSENEIMSVIKSDKISLYIGNNINFYTFENVEYSLKIKENFFDDGLEYEQALKLILNVLSDENRTVFVYGKKAVTKLSSDFKIPLKAKIEDLLLIKYLTDFSGKEQTIEDIMAEEGFDKEFPAFAIANMFERYLSSADDKERALYYEMELPLADVLFDMEVEGFRVDRKNLEVMSAYYSEKCAVLLKKIQDIAGEAINPNSSKQLSVVLFEKLGLKHGKKIKTGGYSTDVDILEKLVDQHEIVPLILEYRKYSKLLSTYIDGFKPLIDKNGLIHTTYFQAQTSTGRLSSRKPNLQNIPIRDDEGREVRKLFSAKGDDRILIDADYSQIELRLMAAFSGCKPLIDAFKAGKDIHAETAASVFNVPIGEVTPKMRRDAKAVNFGIIYGISSYGLSDNLGISPKAAADYINKYFEKYPEVKAYMNENVQFARKNGYAVTYFGRKRQIREINASNFNLRSFGERVAMNMPLQGSAADIMKIAMINVWKTLKERGLKSRLILQVHDELVIDAYLSECAEVKQILVDCMEHAVELSVPLTVEAKESFNWYDCK